MSARLRTALWILGILLTVAGGVAYLVTPLWTATTTGVLGAGLLLLLVNLYVNFGGVRGFVSRRSTRYGGNMVVLILIVLAISVLLQALALRHSLRWDLTANQRYSLSPQSRKILKDLKKNVELLAFYQDAQEGRQSLKDLLDEYAYNSPRFTYRFVDPDRSPNLAKQYKVTTYGTLVLQSGDKRQTIAQPTEQDITNALIKVTQNKEKTIYVTTGHGEKQLSDTERGGFSDAKQAIEDQNYKVKELVLLRQKDVPADAAVVVIAGPTRDFFPEEIAALKRYVNRGGKLLVMLEPQVDTPRLNKFLEDYGIEPGNNEIIDRLSRVFGASYTTPIVTQYAKHAITENFGVASFFPSARSMTAEKKPPTNVQAQSLAFTGPNSWAETNLRLLDQGTAEFNEGSDIPGPVPVAAVATITPQAPDNPQGLLFSGKMTPPKKDKARIVAFGDSDFASNGALGLSGNKDLFLNSLSWLAEEGDLIAIRPKNQSNSPLLLSAAEGRMAFWFPLVILPALVLGTGMLVMWRRRWSR